MPIELPDNPALARIVQGVEYLYPGVDQNLETQALNLMPRRAQYKRELIAQSVCYWFAGEFTAHPQSVPQYPQCCTEGKYPCTYDQFLHPSFLICDSGDIERWHCVLSPTFVIERLFHLWNTSASWWIAPLTLTLASARMGAGQLNSVELMKSQLKSV